MYDKRRGNRSINSFEETTTALQTLTFESHPLSHLYWAIQTVAGAFLDDMRLLFCLEKTTTSLHWYCYYDKCVASQKDFLLLLMFQPKAMVIACICFTCYCTGFCKTFGLFEIVWNLPGMCILVFGSKFRLGCKMSTETLDVTTRVLEGSLSDR